jgi:predicted 3-demethylubiquinone-9 3-methyltransferase (glyoxalase superfamily)
MAATNPVPQTRNEDRTESRPQKITTFLWFDNNAEEAANFYVSVFKNSRILETSYYTEVGPGPKGSVMTISFELDGQHFTALNGGPQFKFTEAISLVVNCESQEEVDYYWNKLAADGGQEIDCGWVKDKYGLSWQITPVALMRLLTQSDPATVDRVMRAMMQMKKLDLKKLEQAANA